MDNRGAIAQAASMAASEYNRVSAKLDTPQKTPSASAIKLLATLPFIRVLNSDNFTKFQMSACQLKQRANDTPISAKGFLLSLQSHFTQRALARESGRRLHSLRSGYSTPTSDATLG